MNSTENSSFSQELPNLQIAWTKKDLQEALPLKASMLRLLAELYESGTGCWYLPLSPNAKGYVYLSIGGRQGKRVRAHRYFLEKLLGRELGEAELVLHTCDNRACVNPNHLKVGSALDNMQDMIQKDRQSNQYKRGINHVQR